MRGALHGHGSVGQSGVCFCGVAFSSGKIGRKLVKRLSGDDEVADVHVGAVLRPNMAVWR